MSYLLFLCLTQSLTAHPSIKILVCTWILTYTNLLNCVNFGQLDIPECISPWPECRCHGVLEKFILVRNALFIFLHFLLATVHEHLGVGGVQCHSDCGGWTFSADHEAPNENKMVDLFPEHWSCTEEVSVGEKLHQTTTVALPSTGPSLAGAVILPVVSNTKRTLVQTCDCVFI